eukprot:g7215.t1
MCRPKKNGNHAYRESLFLGHTSMRRQEVKKVTQEMKKEWEWMGHTYRLLSKNCIHFSAAFSKRLGVKEVPRWVFGMASLAQDLVQSLANRTEAMGRARHWPVGPVMISEAAAVALFQERAQRAAKVESPEEKAERQKKEQALAWLLEYQRKQAEEKEEAERQRLEREQAEREVKMEAERRLREEAELQRQAEYQASASRRAAEEQAEQERLEQKEAKEAEEARQRVEIERRAAELREKRRREEEHRGRGLPLEEGGSPARGGGRTEARGRAPTSRRGAFRKMLACRLEEQRRREAEDRKRQLEDENRRLDAERRQQEEQRRREAERTRQRQEELRRLEEQRRAFERAEEDSHAPCGPNPRTGTEEEGDGGGKTPGRNAARGA